MRTLEQIFPGLFAALGITLVATWFALIIMGMANIFVHIIFLFIVAFIFELYSTNQQYQEKAEERRHEEEIRRLLKRVEEDEPEEMIQELEEAENL